MGDNRVFPPALTLAELRTITAVIGKPPIRGDTTLPTPWATSSRLLGEIFFSGSSLSTASTLSSDSRLAIRAMVIAIFHTTGFPMAEKSGKVREPKKEPKDPVMGILARWLPSSANPGPRAGKTHRF